MKMYNREKIKALIHFIEKFNGIGDKTKLANEVKQEFSLTKDRSVYYCEDFAIRFSFNHSNTKRISNTILSLSNLQKYDHLPFFVCIVSPDINHLLLANTTFLNKISHSSKELRVDNIKGSFNGSDILLSYNGFENEPVNFEELYAFHSELSFNDNLERLVENSNQIEGRVNKFIISDVHQKQILDSIYRANKFACSDFFKDLEDDLNKRVASVENEIAIAAFIDNVNLRGRIIEFLITDTGSNLKEALIDALQNNTLLPSFKTEDKLGDYTKYYTQYHTETDIKTKVLFGDSNPKAYNIDKLLEFLSQEESVYIIYLLGVDENKRIVSRLCSALDKRLIEATTIQHHWAGRNSRGVTQFIGKQLKEILSTPNNAIFDIPFAENFLHSLINR